MEEEAPEIPHNAFLGDDRVRFGDREAGVFAPPSKKLKTKEEKKEKKKMAKSSSSSS